VANKLHHRVVAAFGGSGGTVAATKWPKMPNVSPFRYQHM